MEQRGPLVARVGPRRAALTFYSLLIAFNWLVAAALFHQRGAVIGAASGAAAFLSVFFPRFAIVIGGACAFLGFSTLSWTQRPAARQ